MSGIDIALVALGVAFLAALTRVVMGPSVADRAVAADVCFFAAVGAVALLAISERSVVFADVVLVATLLGFVATIALARLVGKDHR